MEIRPLTAAKADQSQQCRPAIVQQRLHQLKPNYVERAHLNGKSRPTPSGNICSHHQTLNSNSPHENSSAFGQQQQQIGTMLFGGSANQSQPVILDQYGSQQPMKLLQVKQEPSSSQGIASSQQQIGLHVGSNQMLAALYKEYSHFQNVTLQKELADSRTISLDRNDLFTGEEVGSGGGLTTLDVQRQQQRLNSAAVHHGGHHSGSVGMRHTILSRREQVVGSEKQKSLFAHQQDTNTGQSNNEKRNFVNAKIIGSLKSGYGFLPNFSQPNNQGTRMIKRSTATESSLVHSAKAQSPSPQHQQQRTIHHRQQHHQQPMLAQNSHIVHVVNDLRIFARSPDAMNIKQSFSPAPTIQRKKTCSSQRPTSTDLPAPTSKANTGQTELHEHVGDLPQEVAMPSEKGDHSVSRTDADAASNSSPKELQYTIIQNHKYGSNEGDPEATEERVMDHEDEDEEGVNEGNVSKNETGANHQTHMTTDTPELLSLTQPPPSPPLQNSTTANAQGQATGGGTQQQTQGAPSSKQKMFTKGIAKDHQQALRHEPADSCNQYESMIFTGSASSGGPTYQLIHPANLEQVVDYNSQSLYERYNKVITSRRGDSSPVSAKFTTSQYNNQTDRSKGKVVISPPQHRLALIGQNSAQNATNTAAAAKKSVKSSKTKKGSKKNSKPISPKNSNLLRLENQQLSFSPRSDIKYGLSGGNQVTVQVFRDDKEMARGLGSHGPVNKSRSPTTSGGGAAKKINSSGRPIRKTTGRLETLRVNRDPQPGQVSLPFPINNRSGSHDNELLSSFYHGNHLQHIKLANDAQTSAPKIEEEGSPPDAGSQNQANEDQRIAQFEVIKSVEQIINFTDTASEGTNRMSAAHLKVKQSKSTKKSGSPTLVLELNTAESQHIIQESLATIEPVEGTARRSVEIIKQKPNIAEVNEADQINTENHRQNTKSKSIDSAGNGSALHDMLKPKGIEVHTSSLAPTTSQDVGTPRGTHLNASPVKTQLSNIVETKRERKPSERTIAEVDPGHEKIQIDSEMQKTFDQRNQSGAANLSRLNFEAMKLGDTGEVITAKLASSNSDRAISMPKQISIVDDSKTDKPGDNLEPKKLASDYTEGVNLPIPVVKEGESQTSIVSSIKTSIDDETLMELAQKGIQARTPKGKDQRLQLQIQTTETKQAIEKHRSELLSASAPDTPESVGGVRIHLNSTLNQSSRSIKIHDENGQEKGSQDAVNSITAVASTGKDEIVSNLNILTHKSSNRSIIYQQSPHKPIVVGGIIKKTFIQADKQPEKAEPRNIMIGTLDTPGSSAHSRKQNTNVQATVQSKNSMGPSIPKENLTFTAIYKKQSLPIGQNAIIERHAEAEAMSQTDFPPLPPLDPEQFSLTAAMHGNYDQNLMFGMPQETDVSLLQDFSIAGQMTAMDVMQPESMMASHQKQDDKGVHSTLSRGHTPIPFGSSEPASHHHFHQINTDPRMMSSPDQKGFKLDLNNMSAIQTDQLMSNLGTPSHFQLHSLNGINFVKIQSNEVTRGSSPAVGMFDPSVVHIDQMVRSDHPLERKTFMQAANRGQRIIVLQEDSPPRMFITQKKDTEQDLEEKPHSPHTIMPQDWPIQPLARSIRAKSIEERNAPILSKKADKHKYMLHGLRGQATLKQKNLTKELMALTNDLKSQECAIEGVDKSIGEDTSHSSGSFTNKRKYYILNIDNTNDDASIHPLAYGKNRQKVQQKPKSGDREKIMLKQKQQLQQQQQNINNASMLSKDYPIIVEQKSNQELDIIDGVLTDRHRDSSSNEKLAINQLQSARNQTQSRQEDLDTVYLASTMQFNKDLHAANMRIGTKSPEFKLKTNEVATYVSERSQNSMEKVHEDDIRHIQNQHRDRFKTMANLSKRNTTVAVSQTHCNSATERRQIQLKNGQPVDSKPASPTLSSEIKNQRLSGKKRQNSQNQEVLDNRSRSKNGGSLISEAMPSSTFARDQKNQRFHTQDQIAIRDESDTNGLAVTASKDANNNLTPGIISRKGKSYLNHTNHDSRDPSQLRSRVKSPLNKTADHSESTGSLEKLYHPVAAIEVNKSRQFNTTLNEMDKTRSDASQADAKKIRPKTSGNAWNSRNRNQMKTVDDDSPRNRKIIYLMHKRKEIALRRTRLNTAQSEANTGINAEQKQAATAQQGKTSGTGQPKTFFNQVSQQLSRVFSLDRTSTQVATTLATTLGNNKKHLENSKNNSTAQNQSINQSQSMARTSLLQTRAQARNNLIHLTINPCSTNATLQPSAANPVHQGSDYRRRNLQGMDSYNPIIDNQNINVISGAIISPFIHSSVEVITDEQRQKHTRTGDQHHLRHEQIHVNDPSRPVHLKFDAYLEQRQQQRAGLKTAEGRHRMKHYLSSNPREQMKRKAVLSNASIDMNDKFKGFDRRQTHDDMLKKIQTNQQYAAHARLQDASVNTMDSQDYQVMLSNPKLHPTLLKRDQVFSARIPKPPQAPISKTTFIAASGRKTRTKSTRIKRKSLSTQHASQLNATIETGKSALNEKESCNRDSFAQLIREDPITEAYMSKDFQTLQHKPTVQLKEHSGIFSNYTRREELQISKKNTVVPFYGFSGFDDLQQPQYHYPQQNHHYKNPQNRIRVNTKVNAFDTGTDNGDMIGTRHQNYSSTHSNSQPNSKSQAETHRAAMAAAEAGGKQPMLKTEKRTQVRRLQETQVFRRNQKIKQESIKLQAAKSKTGGPQTPKEIANMMLGSLSGSVFQFEIRGGQQTAATQRLNRTQR